MTRDLFDFALVLTVLILLYSWAGQRDLQDAEIAEKIARDVQEARDVSPCDGITIRQFGPGERWHPKAAEQEPECVARAKTLPPYLMSLPCNHDGERCR